MTRRRVAGVVAAVAAGASFPVLVPAIGPWAVGVSAVLLTRAVMWWLE